MRSVRRLRDAGLCAPFEALITRAFVRKIPGFQYDLAKSKIRAQIKTGPGPTVTFALGGQSP